MSESKVLSVVVPVYRSEEILPETHRRLSEMLDSLGPELDHEVIFVNDGSPDDALGALRAIAASDPKVVVISLSRNFGHQIAITAGLDAARGDAAVIIDDDLQDPPEAVIAMVEKWREGYQVVHGVRSERNGETWFKRATAAAFYRLMASLSDTPLPVDSGDFRLIDRIVIDALSRMREESRYVRGMVAWTGFRQCQIEYAREARFAGKGSYTLRRMLKLAIDGALSFSVRPLQVMSHIGLTVTIGAALWGAWLVIERLMGVTASVPGWTSTIVAVLFMGGLQILSIGVLGAYIGRIFYEAKRRPLYFVAERIGGTPDDEVA
ncbi:MAG TPA: glycosyltransferase family 2 protein [Coriobacteriia bacterium]